MNKNHLLKDVFKELRQIRNPHLKFKEPSLIDVQSIITDQGKKHPLKLSKKVSLELSTARNRNLIYPDEQEKLRKTVVAFFGMSVGSHAALTWMMESRADVIKIVDPDRISATNLNRIRTGWNDVDNLKVKVVEKQLQEINPYATIIASTNVKEKDIRKIFYDLPRLNLIVDEIDDVKDKILLRQFARELKIPVISAIDVEDDVFIDVERYDSNKQQKFFNDRLSNIEKINFNRLKDKEKKKIIIQLVGLEHNSERMLNSLLGIGASIATWPQLGATATISGGVIATLIKKIILGEEIKSGRYYLLLNDIFVDDYENFNRINERRKKIKAINKFINKNDLEDT